MQPFDKFEFDKDYLARREKQIQDMYMERSMTWACLVVGAILAGVSLLLMNNGGLLGPITMGIALLFVVSAIFMVFSTRGKMAADRAVQKELEQMAALYSNSGEKPKRHGHDNAVRLSDDGELVEESRQAGAKESHSERQ